MTAFSPAVNFETKDISGTGLFEGYASDFSSVPDHQGDVVEPGAFRRSLQTHKKRETHPAMLWAHDGAEPIGAWKEIEEDDHGLKVRGQLALKTRRGQEAHSLLSTGADMGLSIGFIANDYEYEGRGKRLKEIDLREISLVAMPANWRAKVTSYKSLAEMPRTEYEQHVRQRLGLSNRGAKRFAALTHKALNGEAADVEILSLVRHINDMRI